MKEVRENRAIMKAIKIMCSLCLQPFNYSLEHGGDKKCTDTECPLYKWKPSKLRVD